MRQKETAPLTREQALNRAATLCSGSEYCTSQVMEKLLGWGFDEADAATIVQHLTDEKFIDDERFARAYCHDKFCYNHWGRVKIQQMLRHLRLGSADIAAGLDVIDEDAYREAILDVARQKNRSIKDTDPYQRKGKLVRHLLSRGFEMDLALDAAESLLCD